jgi:hypothetical protein
MYVDTPSFTFWHKQPIQMAAATPFDAGIITTLGISLITGSFIRAAYRPGIGRSLGSQAAEKRTFRYRPKGSRRMLKLDCPRAAISSPSRYEPHLF